MKKGNLLMTSYAIAVLVSFSSSFFCNSPGTILSSSHFNIDSMVSVNHLEIDWSITLHLFKKVAVPGVCVE
jgi:hypothetical protein